MRNTTQTAVINIFSRYAFCKLRFVCLSTYIFKSITVTVCGKLFILQTSSNRRLESAFDVTGTGLEEGCERCLKMDENIARKEKSNQEDKMICNTILL